MCFQIWERKGKNWDKELRAVYPYGLNANFGNGIGGKKFSVKLNYHRVKIFSTNQWNLQQTSTCSKSLKETPGKSVKYVQS